MNGGTELTRSNEQTHGEGAGATHGAERVGDAGPGAMRLQELLARELPAAGPVAEVLREHPSEHAGMLALLHRTAGNRFVGEVVQLLQVVAGGEHAATAEEAANGADGADGADGAAEPELAAGSAFAAGPAIMAGPAPGPAPVAGDQAAKGSKAKAPKAPKAAKAAPPGRELDTDYLKGYTLLDGKTTLDKYQTTKDEAKVLGEIRHSDKRLDPAWLLAAQNALHVGNASGAFNTDTLRALRAIRPGATAADILGDKDGLLTKLAPGSPFVSTNAGFGKAKLGSTGRASHAAGKLADQGARALGYTDYAAYKSTFVEARFLSVKLKHGGDALTHPHMLERLQVAEQWLRQRHGKTDASGDKEIRGAIGWNGEGTGAYGDSVESIGKFGAASNGPHLHAYGIAVDFDSDHNPWVFDKKRQSAESGDTDQEKTAKQQNNWWVEMFERQFRQAAQVYGGEALTADRLADWSETMSTEELYARVHEASESFRKYLQLGETGTDDEIITAFVDKAKFTPEQAKAAIKELRGLAKKGGSASGKRFFKDNLGRGDADSITTHSQELLVALRDVAGLSWGGSEMSHNVNGDFMHFDCRHDSFGSRLLSFALANRENPDSQETASLEPDKQEQQGQHDGEQTA